MIVRDEIFHPWRVSAQLASSAIPWPVLPVTTLHSQTVADWPGVGLPPFGGHRAVTFSAPAWSHAGALFRAIHAS